MGATTAQPDLEAVEIHDVLSNERRQLILEFLRDAGGILTARELSEKIAEVETGESPPPRNIRQSAYVSLHQTHLPKLNELDIVEYDQSAKTVELNERAEQVSVYMERVPKYGLSWAEYYLAVSVLGLLLIVAGEGGVPVLAGVGSLTFAAATFALIIASAVYQTYSQQSSVLHRLRD
jgi:hypothetical protein